MSDPKRRQHKGRIECIDSLVDECFPVVRHPFLCVTGFEKLLFKNWIGLVLNRLYTCVLER